MIPVLVLLYATILQLESRIVPHTYELENMMRKQAKTTFKGIDMSFCVINFKMHIYTS